MARSQAQHAQDIQAAAERRRSVSLSEVDDRTRDSILALLEERRGYVTRGLSDRVAQVDAALARHDYVAGTDA